MAHISRKKLSENTEQALKDRLVDMLRIIGKNRGVKFSLNELLTYTEGVMLAKRLTIIYLIYKEKSTLDIAETLGVSTSTVIRIEKIYDRGGYRNIRKVFHLLEPTLLEIIETLLSLTPSNVARKMRKDFWEA